MAESVDGRHLWLGEAKWERSTDLSAMEARLRRLGGLLPCTAGRTVHMAVWAREVRAAGASRRRAVRTPAQVIASLK